MRTSLNNIKAIDDYLLGGMATGDALLFEANMLLSNGLADEVHDQQNAYLMIRKYGCQSIKAEILAVQQTLATAPRHSGFMEGITNLFKKC